MKQLLEYLMSIQAGSISDTAKLETLLATCWDEFAGSKAEGMADYKLHGRVDDVHWNPPVLTFVIERHGETVLGSTRAERHIWMLNVDTRTASCQSVGHRQVRPMQARLDIGPIAEEIVQLIIGYQKDERLRWNKDGSVRVQIGKVLPEGSAVKQTLNGRRRRFQQTVDELLSNAGWQKVRLHVYAPPAT